MDVAAASGMNLREMGDDISSFLQGGISAEEMVRQRTAKKHAAAAQRSAAPPPPPPK